MSLYISTLWCYAKSRTALHFLHPSIGDSLLIHHSLCKLVLVRPSDNWLDRTDGSDFLFLGSLVNVQTWGISNVNHLANLFVVLNELNTLAHIFSGYQTTFLHLHHAATCISQCISEFCHSHRLLPQHDWFRLLQQQYTAKPLSERLTSIFSFEGFDQGDNYCK